MTDIDSERPLTDRARTAAPQRAPIQILVVAFLCTLLFVLGIGSMLLAQRTGDTSASADWAAAAGSEALIASLVEEQGCEAALAHLARRASGVDAPPPELNAFGVCLARTGDYTGARRAFGLAVLRGAPEDAPAHANREALEQFLVARQYVDALDLSPAPESPTLHLRTPVDDR